MAAINTSVARKASKAVAAKSFGVDAKAGKLAYSLLGKAERLHVDAIVKAGALAVKQRDAIHAHMAALFPNKRSLNYALYSNVLRAIKEESNTGPDKSLTTFAYQCALAWFKAKFGGTMRKDGTISNKATAPKAGMTFGRFANAMDAKCKAITEYIAKAPKRDIEPATLAKLAALAETVAAFETEWAAIREAYTAAQEAKAA